MDDFGDVEELLDAQIEEVHGVLKAANGFKFLLMKAQEQPSDLQKARARRLAANPAELAGLRAAVAKAQTAVAQDAQRAEVVERVLKGLQSTAFQAKVRKAVESAVNRHPTPWVTTDVSPKRRS